MSRLVTKRTRAIVAAAVAVAALVLSGCTASGATSQQSASSTFTMAQQPSGPLARNFNPFNVSNAAYTQGTQAFIYEPLLQFNLAKAGQVYPWLAQSYTWNSTGTSLTMHLRTGVKWTDGKPFSAADVVFTYQLIKKDPSLNTTGVDFTSISAPNSNTVVIDFAAASFSDLYYIASVPIVPQHIWSTVSNPSTFSDTDPVGTGPYTLTSFNNQGWTYTKNPHYWQPGKPAITTINVPIFDSPSSATLALTQGKLDWSGIFVNNISKVFASKDPTHNQFWQPADTTNTIVPNLDKWPLSNLAVRQAISMAIDRTQVSQAGSQGQEPGVSNGTGIVLPAQQSYISPTLAQYKLTSDPAKAKSILTAAGFTMGSDGYFHDSSGRQLAFSLEQPSTYADFMTDAQVVAAQLKKVGINVTVDGVSVQKYTADVTNGTFDAAIHTGVPGPTPYFQYDSWLNSSLTAPIGKAAASNFSRFSSPQADKLLAEYADTNNTAEQQQAITQLGTIVATQLPVIPLVYGVAWAQFNTTKFTGFPSADNPYMLGAPTSPYAEYTILQLKPAK